LFILATVAKLSILTDQQVVNLMTIVYAWFTTEWAVPA